MVLETALYLQSAHLNGLRSALVVELASSRGSLLPTKGIYYQLQTKGGISLGAFDFWGGILTPLLRYESTFEFDFDILDKYDIC